VVAGLTQDLDRLRQQARRQRRAVAIDEQHAVMPRRQKRARRADQHMAEIIASLQQQSEPRRKQLPHDALGTRRSIDAIAAPAEHLGHRFDCRGDIAQEAGR
jgi:hypothetical protein